MKKRTANINYDMVTKNKGVFFMEWYKGKEYETILTWVEDSIGFVQLNRPNAYNALNHFLIDEAYDHLDIAIQKIRIFVLFIICGNEKRLQLGLTLQPWPAIIPLKPVILLTRCTAPCSQLKIIINPLLLWSEG